MKQRALHLLLLLAFAIGVAAQSRLYNQYGFIYADAMLSTPNKAMTVQAMIDTGCSLCMIDSTIRRRLVQNTVGRNGEICSQCRQRTCKDKTGYA